MKERFKGIYKGQEHEEEDINSYLRKRKTCIVVRTRFERCYAPVSSQWIGVYRYTIVFI